MSDADPFSLAAERPLDPIRPKRALPPGACDAHVHVNSPAHPFPVQVRTYPPPDAPVEKHIEMLDTVGFDRSVVVQLMAYGDDNRALMIALASASRPLRGIGVLRAHATDEDFERLHACGVRGLRFVDRPLPGINFTGSGVDDLLALAPRMKALDWIAEVSTTCDRVIDWAPRLRQAGVPVVLENMAGCLPGMQVSSKEVQDLLSLLGSGDFWAKLTVCRVSKRYPDFDDVRQLHDAFVRAAPDRLVWGSDWPHALMHGNAPQVGHLLDLFDEWIGHDPTLRQAILVDNPQRLFR